MKDAVLPVVVATLLLLTGAGSALGAAHADEAMAAEHSAMAAECSECTAATPACTSTCLAIVTFVAAVVLVPLGIRPLRTVTPRRLLVTSGPFRPPRPA